jgi:hypothetical protein
MKHDKPEYNIYRKCLQSEVDEQDNNIRQQLKDNLLDLAIAPIDGDGGFQFVFRITELGKLFNETNP